MTTKRLGNRRGASRIAGIRRDYEGCLRALLAYSQAPAGSRELQQRTKQLVLLLPEAGLGEVFVDQLRNESLRQHLRESFENCFPELAWWPPAGAFPLEVTSLQVAVDRVTNRTWPVFSGKWPAPFWFAVVDTMQHAMHLLKECRGCRAKFVRRGLYCSSSCRGKVRQRKWYKLHKQVASERKHAAYVARRREQYPRARVVRRPRLQRIATEGLTGGRKAA